MPHKIQDLQAPALRSSSREALASKQISNAMLCISSEEFSKPFPLLEYHIDEGVVEDVKLAIGLFRRLEKHMGSVVTQAEETYERRLKDKEPTSPG